MPEIFTSPRKRAKKKSMFEQFHLALQSRLKVQNALAEQTFIENSALKLNLKASMPISNILEDISQNISKMDQNLYSTKANMEEILRTNLADNEFVSLN